MDDVAGPSGAIQTLGLAAQTVNQTVTYNITESSNYDARLRPSSLTVTGSGATETLGYTWDPNGNLLQETIDNTKKLKELYQ
jgi:YD repeat-containing protein